MMPIGNPQSTVFGNRSEGPFVSVIIPTYNQAGYVGEAIRSVQQQTYTNFEIIVIDDGSSDNCWDVVAGFGDSVRYIRQENQGLAGARNTGIRAARGELIGLLDSDDQWLPGYLQAMLSLVERFPEASVFYSSAQAMDAEGRELPQFYGGPAVPPDKLYQVLLRANFLIPSTILMRREVIIEAGLFDQKLRSCEDWDLWLRILPEGIIVGTPECLVRYRIHGSSLSTNPTGMQRATQAVIEKQFGADDGQWQSWTDDKRRAYGGVYRYYLLISIQRQNDWKASERYLRLALQTDPTLSIDLDLFYDLVMGSQPQGYRDTPIHLELEENAKRIDALLSEVFKPPVTPALKTLKYEVLGTAYYAIGLLAYNTNRLSMSRSYLFKALRYRPELWRDKAVTGNLVRTLAGRKGLSWLRQLRRNKQKLEIA